MILIKTCMECGKEFPVLWPELWTYKARPKWQVTIWFCSYGCMRKNERRAKEAMEAIKKDQAPAKRPGRKPKQEAEVKPAEERQKVELVYDPGILEEYRREQSKKIFGVDPLEVFAVKSRVIQKGAYIKSSINDRTMSLRIGEKELVLRGRSWLSLTAEILVALEQLGVKTCDEGRDTETDVHSDQAER